MSRVKNFVCASLLVLSDEKSAGDAFVDQVTASDSSWQNLLKQFSHRHVDPKWYILSHIYTHTHIHTYTHTHIHTYTHTHIHTYTHTHIHTYTHTHIHTYTHTHIHTYTHTHIHTYTHTHNINIK